LEQNYTNIENLKLASNKQRIRAFIIDDLVITFLVMLLMWDQIQYLNGDLVAILILVNNAFAQIIILKFLYQAFFIWYYGATLGKMVSKIKVIDYNNFGKVNIIQAILRSSSRIISELIFYIGFIIAFYTDSKQTFHDKIGKTLVVNV
jgi:uncharacterized RDD family membrane protein YckC